LFCLTKIQLLCQHKAFGINIVIYWHIETSRLFTGIGFEDASANVPNHLTN